MADVRRLEQQCKALGQRRRIRILSLLKRERRATVGRIVQFIGCTFPTASQHVRVLKDAGIVLDRRRGKYVLYVLSPQMGDVARALLRVL